MEFRLWRGAHEFNAQAVILAPSNNSPVGDPIKGDIKQKMFWNLNVCGHLQFGSV
jgi:hypothetical protein